MVTLIDRMSVGSFQETLSYVYIPPLDPPVTEKPAVKSYNTYRKRPGQVQETTKMTRNDLVKVFDKLSFCGVTRILRLQVDDLYDPAHTDSAIELALQGLGSFAPRHRQQSPVQMRNPTHPSICIESW